PHPAIGRHADLLDGPLRDGAVPAVALLAEASYVRGEETPHLVCVAHRVPDEPVDDLDPERLVVRFELAAVGRDLPSLAELQTAALDEREGGGLVKALVPVHELRAVVPVEFRERCGVAPRAAGAMHGERHAWVGLEIGRAHV